MESAGEEATQQSSQHDRTADGPDIESFAMNLKASTYYTRSMQEKIQERHDELQPYLDSLLRDAANEYKWSILVYLLANGVSPDHRTEGTNSHTQTVWDLSTDAIWDSKTKREMYNHRGRRRDKQRFRRFLIRSILRFLEVCDHGDDSAAVTVSLSERRTSSLESSTEMSVSSHSRRNTKCFTLKELRNRLKQQKHFTPPAYNTYHHFHIPVTNGAILLVIFLLLVKQEELVLDPKLICGSELLLWFWRTFRPSFVTTVQWELDSLDPICRSDESHCFINIVFPVLALQYEDKWLEGSKSYREWAREDRKQRGPTLESEHNIQYERTLDETYIPVIPEVLGRARNNDQVVQRYCRDRSHSGRKAKDGVILMVPQLWIWQTESTIVTAYSLSRRTCKYLRVADDWSPSAVSRSQSTRLCVLMMLRDHIAGFSEDRGRTPSALAIYETELHFLSLEVITYAKETRSSDMALVKEWRFMHELLDFQEELNMISHILGQQEEVFETFLEEAAVPNYKVRPNTTTTKTKIIAEAEAKVEAEAWEAVGKEIRGLFKSYAKQISKLKIDAQHIERTVKDMLELKRAYSSIRDAHYSLYVSTAVIIFTIVTVVFAPLSFLAALLALRFKALEVLYSSDKKSDSETVVYDSRKLGGTFAGGVLITFLFTVMGIGIGIIWMRHRADTDPSSDSQTTKIIASVGPLYLIRNPKGKLKHRQIANAPKIRAAKVIYEIGPLSLERISRAVQEPVKLINPDDDLLTKDSNALAAFTGFNVRGAFFIPITDVQVAWLTEKDGTQDDNKDMQVNEGDKDRVIAASCGTLGLVWRRTKKGVTVQENAEPVSIDETRPPFVLDIQQLVELQLKEFKRSQTLLLEHQRQRVEPVDDDVGGMV